mgnify:CR=1 FL=1
MKNEWLRDSVFRSVLSCPEFVEKSFDLFGSYTFTPNDIPLFRKRFIRFEKERPDLVECHLSALSEEILLSGCYQSICNEGFLPLQNHLPFGGSYPRMSDLAGLDSAAAVFPLHHHEKPLLGHLWVFRDPQNRLTEDHRLSSFFGDRANALLEDYPGIKVFVVMTRQTQFTGSSWQLAFHLALQALDKCELKRKLASHWMVTGAVKSRRIKRVGIGKKTEIETARNWLFPSANYNSWPQSWDPPKPARIAETIEEAVDVILDNGTAREGPAQWPDSVETVYSFSSEAETPIAAFSILSGAKKVMLFCTEDERISVKPAENVRRFLESNSSIKVDISEQRISSTDVYLAEKYLLDHLKLRSNAREKIIVFNVTNGNKIMHIALANIANRYPNIIQVYRDRNNEGLDYVAIYHEGRLPVTRVFENGFTSSLTSVSEADRFSFLQSMLTQARIDDFTGFVSQPVLIGNSYPWSLLRGRPRLEEKNLDELKAEIALRGSVSYWGHKNTLQIASDLLETDLTPEIERPSIQLSPTLKPSIGGREFSQCWVMAPVYIEGFRPAVGFEVTVGMIENWRIICLCW